MTPANLWDRDYLLDDRGNFLKVVGERHPKAGVVSYVKYFPSQYGARDIQGKQYGYNSFVPKSFVILQEDHDRVAFSPFHGGILTVTPSNRIKQCFSCTDKLRQIRSESEEYQRHPVGAALVQLLSYLENHVPIDQIGITGSFLIDAYNLVSDIDLVCYGEDVRLAVSKALSECSQMESYERHALRLYNRRMIHMAPMDFSLLMKQEQRKIQGLWGGKIHVNCQPLRCRQGQTIFKDLTFIEVGEISCIAQIENDQEGNFAPAYYEIRVLDIINSVFDGSIGCASEIKAFISYIGAYAGSFREGERVYLDGKLVQVRRGAEQFYAIEVTPWNTQRTFKAQLLPTHI